MKKFPKKLLLVGLAVLFCTMHGLGQGALLPREEFRELLFSSEQEMEEAIPHLVAIRQEDHEAAQRFRIQGTVYWEADPSYLKNNSQKFSLVLNGKEAITSINEIKWLGHLLLSSRFPDEQYVMHALSTFSLRPLNLVTPFFHYGHLYIYSVGAGLQLTKLLGWVRLVRERDFYMRHPGEGRKLFLVGKWVGLLAGAFALWFLFLLGQGLYDTRTGLIASALFAFTPAVTVEAHALKPWVFGQVWLCLTLYGAWRLSQRGRLVDYLLSGLAAGLAVSSGLLFMYAVLFPIGVHWLRWRSLSRRQWWGLLGVIVGCAAATFVLTTPSILVYPRQFMVMISRQHHMNSHLRMLLTPRWHSVAIQGFARGFGTAAFVAFAGGLLVCLAYRRLADLWLVGGWAAYYIIYFKSFEWQTERHFLGAVPLMVLIAARGIGWLLKHPPAGFRSLGKIVLAVILLLGFSESLFYDLIYLGDDSLVRAGRWINAHVAEGATIGQAIGGDGHAHNFVPYRYLNYWQVQDADPGLARIHTDLPDYYIAMKAREWQDPFLNDVFLPRHYEMAAQFRHEVPVLGRFFKNRAAFYWVDEVLIFRRRPLKETSP